MPDPVIAGRAPLVVELRPGTYWWCSCGRSKTQPFCDGSHSGPPDTGFSPHEFTIKDSSRCALCTCKKTKNGPMCDGSHKSLPANNAEATPVE